ncbi:uncharacterized protein LOC110731184 [Chenopodium quinoa]|uniref:uncharacterized protein LOC110731184 n=1 Tax=Chenopodium quinoa TaxID=63459 RepID=UPI000B78E2A8|nr:uncharacterized protein LOC110731184 [Chenopodium quinoa]
MPELLVTLKLPIDIKRTLQLLFDAHNASFPNSIMSMNNHNLNTTSLPITCMIWNTQGTGSREFINVLKEIVRVNKPCVLALVETHMGGDHAQKIASILNYNGHTRVDAQGYSGGIWIYWKPELVKVDPITKHNQYITMMITRVGEIPWYFTAIYASPDPSKRSELWYEFRKFADNNNQPWLLAGDFNETRYSWERNSSCPETSRRSERFNAWVDDTQLLELEFSGPSHTWARGNSYDTYQSARLDRALCNSEWGLRFDLARVKHFASAAIRPYPSIHISQWFLPSLEY